MLAAEAAALRRIRRLLPALTTRSPCTSYTKLKITEYQFKHETSKYRQRGYSRNCKFEGRLPVPLLHVGGKSENRAGVSTNRVGLERKPRSSSVLLRISPPFP